jgi:hypothetical protein
MKKYLKFLYALAIVILIGCTGDNALFDELSNSRVTVIIKGTFESTTDSSSIKGWDTTVSATQSIDDSVNDMITDTSETFPNTFMVDIAEMRLAKEDGGSDDKVAYDRQVFTAAVSDTDPFFNGVGVVLDCDDIKPGKRYGMVMLYIRKLIFDNATQWHFDTSGNIEQDDAPEEIFHENDVYGFDFNQLMVNTYYDYLKQNYDDIIRVFPLKIPIDGGLIVNKDDKVVIEVRLIIKNFIKLYEYNFYNDNGYRAAYHYWAVSDWLRAVEPDDIYMGGNLLGVARVYKKEEVATVSGTTASPGYVIAIPATDMDGNPQSIADYFLDDDNPSWTRPSVYEPVAPSFSYSTVEGYLDYYLRYEQYKVEYNTFVDAVNDGSYETLWNSYDGYKHSLRLPPLVAHSSGSYTLTNVPYGDYLFYFVDDSNVPYGMLPVVDTISSYTGNPVTINSNISVNFP